jgi:hypothetical protein
MFVVIFKEVVGVQLDFVDAFGLKFRTGTELSYFSSVVDILLSRRTP